MIIQESDFRLIPVSNSDTIFDLELLQTIKPKSKEARQEFKNVAYGITLVNALAKVAQYRVCCKHLEEAISIKEYVKEYKNSLKSLERLINE